MRATIMVWAGVALDYATTWIGLQGPFHEANPHPLPWGYGVLTTLAILILEWLRRRTSLDRMILKTFTPLMTALVFYPAIHNLGILGGLIHE